MKKEEEKEKKKVENMSLKDIMENETKKPEIKTIIGSKEENIDEEIVESEEKQ